MELGRLLDEATEALARLDFECLNELERRAWVLQGGPAEGIALASLPDLAARHRVFASLVQSTGRDLAILERGAARARGWAGPQSGRQAEGGVRWVL